MEKNDKANLDSLVQQIISTGQGNLFLSDDGTYKAVTGVSAQDQAKLDKIVINDPNGKLFLANDGTYKAPADLIDLAKADTGVGTNDGNDGLMSKGDKAKVDVLKINDTGKKFLADDGTYKAPATLIDLAKADTAVGANDGNDGLMSKEDKAKLDGIVAEADVTDEEITTMMGQVQAALSEK